MVLTIVSDSLSSLACSFPDRNSISNAGATALASALKDSQLDFFNLGNNKLTLSVKNSVKQAWQAAGKPGGEYDLMV